MTTLANRIIAVVVVVALYLPLTAMVWPRLDAGRALEEKRTLHVRPPFEMRRLASYPAAYENYFNDNFGFRARLVRAYSLQKLKLFGVVPGSKVYAGGRGWFFFKGASRPEGYSSVNHAGQLPKDNIDLFSQVKDRLLANHRYFEGHRVDYVLVVVPDKWSIYPEFVPDGFASPSGRTTVDQLVEFLRESTPLNIIDVRPAMLEAKARGLRLYDKGDTHWNDLGAFVGARTVVEGLNAWREPVPVPDLEAFTVKEQVTDEGDLISLMGLDGLLKYRTVVLEPRETVPYRVVRGDERALPSVVTIHHSLTSPRVLVIRDSFGDALIPFLSRSFGQTHYYWEEATRGMIMSSALDEIQPDVVLEIKVEKFMLDTVKYFNGPHHTFYENRRR